MLYHNYDKIADFERDNAVIVCAHGPSLNSYILEIEKLQYANKILRFSINEWWNIFSNPPDYFCIANKDLSIRQFVDNFFIKTIFYADSVDLTARANIQDSKSNIFGYDQRHFSGMACHEILQKKDEISTNKTMWSEGRDLEYAGFDPHDRCCNQRIAERKTVQEYLQFLCKTEQHYSTGDTVIFHAIAFAIILGCNPIYLTGMDLNCSIGYAGGKQTPYSNDEWRKFKCNTLNDLSILQESAKNRGIEIFNLTSNPWYGTIFPLKDKL